MRDGWRKGRGIAVAGAAGFAALAATGVAAQGLCVVCTGPDAVYRCEAVAGAARSGDPRLGLLCITEIARADGHQSCSVRRQQTACEGPVRTVAPTTASPLAPAGEEAAVPPRPADTPIAQPRESEPPTTVEELAKRTAASSKKQIQTATGAVENAAKKTGEAVEDAAKKTGNAVATAAEKSWRCVSSLFTKCLPD